MLLHTKETAAAQHFKGAPAIPHRQTTFPPCTLCRAAPCSAVPQTDRSCYEEEETIFPSLKKHPLFFPSADYSAMGKLHKEDTVLPRAWQKKKKKKRCSDALLELSNKAYSWWSLKTSVHKIIPKHFFVMQMIDTLFTDKFPVL